MSAGKQRSWRRVFVLLFLAGAGGFFLWLWLWEPPRVERLPVPSNWPNVEVSFKSRALGKLHLWLWRLRARRISPPGVVNINCTLFHLEGWSDDDADRLGLKKPDYADAQGLRVWFLQPDHARVVRNPLPAGGGVAAFVVSEDSGFNSLPFRTVRSGFTGGHASGYTISVNEFFKPQTRGKDIELDMILGVHPMRDVSPVLRSPDQTVNTTKGGALGLRLWLHEGETAFLLQENCPALGGQIMAATIKATPQPQKK